MAESPYLLCRTRETLVAVPLGHVRETMRPLPVTPLADMPAFLVGVAVIRGVPTPVVDVASLILAPEATVPSRFVCVRVEERVVALAFDAVIGVRELPASVARGLPALLAQTATGIVEAIGVLDASLLLILGTALSIPESVWSRLESAGAAA